MRGTLVATPSDVVGRVDDAVVVVVAWYAGCGGNALRVVASIVSVAVEFIFGASANVNVEVRREFRPTFHQDRAGRGSQSVGNRNRESTI